MDLDGQLTLADGAPISSTVTVDGMYMFVLDSAGEYLVEIPATEFIAGGALAGLLSSSGNDILGLAPDPDDDTDDDDNGTMQASGSVASQAITMSYGGEPDVAVDGNDTNGNFTLDFGVIRQAPPTGVSFAAFHAEISSTSERRVALQWSTRNEQDIAGYNVWRTQVSKPANSQKVNAELIAAEGARNGSTYLVEDRTPSSGDYIYMVEVVMLDGSAWRHGPASVSIPHRLWIPMMVVNAALESEFEVAIDAAQWTRPVSQLQLLDMREPLAI